MYAIETVNLTKKYGDYVAVDKLNLQIEKGELFALLGVNGAGKTTAIKMLSCLTSPTDGDAFVHGNSITTNYANVKKIISVSPQETAIAPNLTVKENLEMMCQIYGLRKYEVEEKVNEITEQFSLADVLHSKSSKLSGGWKRKLSIAMSLIGNPSVLYLDEPTLGLDVIARGELWDLIKSMKGSVTIILTTHYLEEAEALSDRIGIMRDGKLLVVGSASELMQLTSTDRFENAFISIVKEKSL